MACPHYDKRTNTCKRSTQYEQLGRDRITQYCKGSYSRCPNMNTAVSFSWEERAKNQQAQARGNNIRMVAPLAFIVVLLLCLLKLQLPILPSAGAAVFAAITALMFTNKYH